MADYAKMKNADLEALLKARGLPTGGKKADMVDRLNKDDEKKKKDTKPAAAAEEEDEIDWDDDEPAKPAESDVASKPAPAPTTASTASAVAAKATTEPAAAAIKAGGQGPVANPTAVPNQVSDIDPSKTNDLSVTAPKESDAKDAKTEGEEKKVESAADFSRGLPPTDLEKEIEKRKARAKKFGLNVDDDETLKKLERAKKFGETAPPKGLDEALPERTRKRGREGDDDNRQNKRRGGGRFRGRGRGGYRGGDRRPDERRDERREPRANAGGTGGRMSEADKAKAEARKNRFAAQPAAN